MFSPMTDIMDNVTNKEAVIKALNRMAASGKIDKLSKGKYYKPEKSHSVNSIQIVTRL